MRKFRLITLLCALLLVLAACGQQELRLDDMPVTVTHDLDNGASLTLPDDWEMLSMTEESAVFANADGSLSLGIMRELAGFSYYSPDELADMAEDMLGGVLADAQVLEREALSKPENAVLVTASGQLDDGPAICQAVVISPLSAVRYFVVLTANSDTFEEYRQVLRDVYATFALNVTEDELYAQFPVDE